MKVIKNCENCNQEFESRPDHNQKFCTITCANIYRTVPLHIRFNRHVGSMTETGCQLWIGSLTDAGYGKIGHLGKTLLAHRVAWELANGDIPYNLHCLHECDNPRCVNVKHLFLGTSATNSKDMVNKDRSCRGENQQDSKLSDEQVREIRKRYSKEFLTQKQLATMYGVSNQLISRIVRKELWKHVK